MNKQIIFGGMLLCAAAFTACNEDFEDWAKPQANAQGEAAQAYGLTIAAASQANVVMDNAPEMVQLVTCTANQAEISNIFLKNITVNGVTLPAEFDGTTVTVSSAKLDSLIEATTFDRSATPHLYTVEAEFAGRLETGEAISVSSITNGTLTPYSNVPEKDAKGYAMLGQWQGWNPSAPTWMTEVEPGVYQAEVITTDDGDNWFKFYRGSGFDDAEFSWDAVALGCAVNGDASTPNLLAWAGDPRFGGFQTPVINGAAKWIVTLDMNKLYYKYERKESKYYIIGNPQGWSTTDMTAMFYALGGNKYTYTTNWTNQWDLKILEGINFNQGDATWGFCFGGINGDTSATGDLTFGADTGAFGPSEQGGWYTLTIDMANMKYEWTAIEEPTATYNFIGLCGGFNEWSADVDLTQLEKAPHNWYVRYTLTSDTELKFRANHGWDTKDWGSDGSAAIDEKIYYLPTGGSNISVPAGTYDFYLNDITGHFNIVRVE
ncbi:MAG: DUF5115 domain-containing protein [Prevotella sp.]|nr:DUF5115 domain-containing protein [Prevotella sp.]